jgi:serpin B
MSKIASLVALVLACSSKPEPVDPPPAHTEPAPQEQPEPPPPAEPTPRPAPSSSEVLLPDEVEVSDATLRALGRATNEFGIDLYKRLPREGNAAMSPASISFALTMTWAGARAETASEIANVLHVASMDAATVHDANASVLRALNGQNDMELRVVDRLFGEATYAFEPDYLALTRRSYGAPLEPLAFRSDAEGARAHINQWIAGQTRGKIHDLLPPGSVGPDTSLVLTNAIYMLAKWKTEFDPARTAAEPFHVGSETPSVNTMHRTGTFSYAEADGVQILEMPYVGDRLAMTIVLPRAEDGLAAVEAALDAQTFERWVGALADANDLPVSLPKFRIEPGEPVLLGEHLRAMGIVRAFDSTQADFTAMANPANASERLFISEAYHKAFVEVDEQGTEAAAATAISMVRGGRVEPVREFRADHPFLFAIRDTRTGMLLFLGRVADPR